MDWEKLGMRINIVDRPMNHRGSQVAVTLPNKDYIIKEPTENYLVLIAQDNRSIIMPQFLTFVINMIRTARGTSYTARPNYHKSIHLNERILR